VHHIDDQKLRREIVQLQHVQGMNRLCIWIQTNNMTCLDMFGVFENGVDLPKAHFNRGNHDQPLNGTVFSDKPISYIVLQQEN
jgi:hypothetical protein